MVLITIIRHGESTDNIRSVWAGWRDAPLTNHGMNQAKALGKALANTPFAIIYTSPLRRAMMTTQSLGAAQPDPQPPVIVSPLLREQHFGIAEGQPYNSARIKGLSSDEHYKRGKFPVPTSRTDRFPGGESREEVAARARRVVDEVCLPYIRDAEGEGRTNDHIAIVAHGILIREVITILVSKGGGQGGTGADYGGMLNTAWARLAVKTRGDEKEPEEGEEKLTVHLMDFNRCEHLQNIVRQKGGIGSAAHDPKQKDIRAFFGGRAVASSYDAWPILTPCHHMPRLNE
ncbi:phosphoglycerate mutase-like protein [Infundibulicybe gibba]|nr:phosphoglycerate mutase-like protein [Infundibulicybe gibba]